ncbi:hypothetical protein BN938_1444 [Mucinivorans hirudinis]|uniref:Acid-resistance membrane protein n=1 Tax=Mucinivorans hirudinis TaxID=1433126 RepID=A0A060R805_9BACT|nr:hypothetical protein BN938_1444 [Mucinivorans hirudinis]
MKNYIQINSLLWGVCTLLVGLFMVFNSEQAMAIIVEILGVMLTVVGAIQVVAQLMQNRKAGVNTFPLGAVVMLVVGVLLLVRPMLWIGMLMLVIGVVMLLLSLNQIVTYVRLSRSGIRVAWGYYVVPVLFAVAGAMTILEPAFLANFIVVFVGFSLIFYGASSLFSYFSLKK